MRRVSYHQTVFDLIDQTPPPLDSSALQSIAEAEGRSKKRLPLAVRDWFARKGIVRVTESAQQRGTLWYDYTNSDWPVSLEALLRAFSSGRETADDDAEVVCIMHENQGVCSWYVELTEHDPLVRNCMEGEWSEMPPFSQFLREWFWGFYCEDFTPLSLAHQADGDVPKPFESGYWLYATVHPLSPPEHDALLEAFDEGPRRKLDEGVEQLDFSLRKVKGTRLRVTTDGHDEPEGRAVFWLSADSPRALGELTTTTTSVLGRLLPELDSCSKKALKVLDGLR
jgi:hypothetical protein